MHIFLMNVFLAAVISSGHNFPSKYVIHCNIPAYSAANSSELMEKAMKNILSLADEKNLKSLAIPSISSGRLVKVFVGKK